MTHAETRPETHGAAAAPNHVELSRRILSLHCDFRYGPEDMARVASAVRRAVEARA